MDEAEHSHSWRGLLCSLTKLSHNGESGLVDGGNTCQLMVAHKNCSMLTIYDNVYKHTLGATSGVGN